MAKLARTRFGMKGGTIVLECSQPTVDVLTATANQMLFSSALECINCIATGSVTVANSGSQTVPIDVGGVPFVSFQVVSGSPAMATIPAMFPNFGFVWAEVDEDSIVFRNTSGASRVINYQIWSKALV